MVFTMKNYKSAILSAVQTAQTGPLEAVNIFKQDVDKSGYKNEMLFFIKPEITKPSKTINLDATLDIVFDKLEQYGMVATSIDVLGAKFLAEKNIMSSHYGVINKLSNNAKATLSQTAKENFQKNYGLSVDAANMLGGHEFLAKYPYFNADSLEILWQNLNIPLANGGTYSKLAGGTYCCIPTVNGEKTYLIDGFHPKQLAHFIEDGKSIITFRLLTNTDWATARNDLIGATNPEKANAGSIRQTFLAKKNELGLEDVSIGSNGVHLSAGPIEGLVELCRFYNMPITDETILQKHIMGKKLLENYPLDKINQVANDINVDYNGKQSSIFEITEDKDTDDAYQIISQSVKA